MLIMLMYGSTATHPMSEKELLEILEVSRRNNGKDNVTGMLLYGGGNFLQVLEGEEADVMALYQKIGRDLRHHHVSMISNRTVRERHFGDWQMGFVNLDEINPAEIPGYSEFLKTPLDAREFFDNPGFAHRFLQVFKDITYN